MIPFMSFRIKVAEFSELGFRISFKTEFVELGDCQYSSINSKKPAV